MSDKVKDMGKSARRSRLGIGVAKWDKTNLGILDVLSLNINDIDRGDVDSWRLLRRSKELLGMRTVTPELLQRFDYRKEWNRSRVVKTVLDLFPSLQYSYSSLRGRRFDSVSAVNILSSNGGSKVRVGAVARSHSIRLDPVDAPKELFKYRQRIQKIIEWAYGNELVPVMMTLTLYHRWHPLEPLCRVLRRAWTSLFGNTPVGTARRQYIGLRGYIRRMEETFNDGGDGSSTNAGWHPHYHIILIVPRENLQLLSDYEGTLRGVWVELVRKYYRAEFGEDIPAAYYDQFKKHGLVFSRYKSKEHAVRCGDADGKVGELLKVHDGKYLAKIMGTEDILYGGDNEVTSLQKCSKSPFDLLRGKLTANLADLWCEYALATKKIPCFTFSQGLGTEVEEYFKTRDSVRRTVEDSVSFEMTASLSEVVVASLKPTDYKWLYQNNHLNDLFKVAKQGSVAVKGWLKESFGIEVLESPPLESPPFGGIVEGEGAVAEVAVSKEPIKNDISEAIETAEIVEIEKSKKDKVSETAVPEETIRDAVAEVAVSKEPMKNEISEAVETAETVEIEKSINDTG